MFKAGRYRLHAAWPAITSCRWCLTELSDGEHVAFAVLEPGRLTDGGNRDAIYRAKARLVVLLELNPPGAELCNLRLQVLDDPGRELVLGGPGASGREQQEQTVLAAAVEECRSLFLASGESELVRIPGPGSRQVPGRDRRKHVPAAQHAALLCSSGSSGCSARGPRLVQPVNGHDVEPVQVADQIEHALLGPCGGDRVAGQRRGQN